MREGGAQRNLSRSSPASSTEASISSRRIETLSTLSPKGTSSRSQKSMSSAAVVAACSKDARSGLVECRRSFSIQRGTSTPSQRRNSRVFIEPHTEKVNTIGTGANLARVAVVGDEVLGGVEVVDDLGHEEPASGLLLGDQAQVLVLPPAVPLRDGHPTEQQVRAQLPPQRLCLGESHRRHCAAGGSADHDGQGPSRVLVGEPGAQVVL